MKKYKKIPGLILALMLLCMSLTVSAFAAETPAFQDVAADSPWIEGINYAAEQGITSGTGNGCFSPNQNITARQWAVMLCRAYDKDIAQKEGDGFGAAELRLGFQERWLDVGAMISPDSGICRKYAYESIFRVEQIPVFSSVLYRNAPAENNFVHVAKENGLCDADADALDLLTRGEAVQLIYLMQTQELHVATPNLLEAMNIVNSDDVHLNDFMLEIKKIPESILYEFNAQGWSYRVDSDYVEDFSDRVGMDCAGCCSYMNKSIYVKADYATVHEFGHFYHQFVGFDDAIETLYEKEAKSAEKVLGEYATTNHKEYFAEVFDYWIQHSDRGELEQVAPDTHAYFTELENGDWMTGTRDK